MSIRGIRWDRYEGPNAIFCKDSSSATEQDGGNAVEETAAANPAAAGAAGRRIVWSSGSIGSGMGCDLGAVAGAIGGRVLAAALRLLCEDYNTAGLPDLFLWSWGDVEAGENPRARFVEVKSERDSLSRRQRLWLSTLRTAGADAEVCHIRD